MHLTKEYIEHPIFSKLEDFSTFYDSLSFSIFRWSSTGTTAIFNIDSYIMSSMKGTVESIKIVLKDGQVNDAYALLRKYHDSIVINIYVSAFLQENCNLETFVVEKINNWIHGKEKLPSYRQMSDYIKTKEALKELSALLSKDERYVKLRSRGNDHMHYNFFYYMMINDKSIYNERWIKFLNTMLSDLINLFIMHFAYLFTLNPHYMISSDYCDALDCDSIPEPGSEYWVANFVQVEFDNTIKKHRTDIASYIKENTMMELQ